MTYSTLPRALLGSVRAAAPVTPEALFRQLQSAVDGHLTRQGEQMTNLEAAMNTLQQSVNGGSYVPGGTASWGDQVVASDALATIRAAAGGARAQLALTPTASITSIGTSGGALVRPDRVEDVAMPRRRLTLRALLGTGTTGSNMVEYPRQVTRDNQAATVAELALKPESNYAWELKQAKVATIAHWVGASRQVLDDSGQLRTLIDGELRYGLALREELQLLLGDGVGTNVLGLIPQATAYDTTGQAAGINKFDVLLRAVAQAETADLPATGVVVNSADWLKMQGIKDGQGKYIGSGPMGTAMPTVWGLDVVPSNSMPTGKFLAGNFANAATLYDRMTPVVLVSTEDRDNFIRNAVTILAEERIALAVRQPAALIYGDYSAAA